MQQQLFELPPIIVPEGRLCRRCKQRKPLKCFQSNRKRANGEIFYKHTCTECRKKIGRVHKRLEKEHKLRLYYEQNGRCALYDESEEDSEDQSLVLDHCHYRDIVRGLLCRIHNTAIGSLGLDCPPEELPWRLTRLARYLRGTTEMKITYEVISINDALKRGLPGADVRWDGPAGNDRYYHHEDWEASLWRCEDGQPVEFISEDGGEPEDNSFYRDGSWIAPALQAAYELGLNSTLQEI